jgi:hypothetical protein
MTPGEVQGLQKLAMSAGGSLTINPQTGLPEAGFLSSMLPMIASAVGSYFGGPIGATAAGALVGGMTNKESPVLGAIMGGVGGYSMGNVGNALSGMGTDAAAMEGAKSIATAQNSVVDPMSRFLAADAVPVPAEMLSRQAAINSGLGQLGSEGGFSRFIGDAATKTSPATGLGGGMGLAKTALPIIAPIGLAAYQAMSNKNPFAPPAADPARFYKTTYNAPKFNPTTGRYDPASYGPGSTSSTAYMAEGGGVEDAANKMFADEPEKNEMEGVSTAQLQRLAEMGTAPQMAAAQKELYARAATQRAAPSDYTRNAAEGGLMGLAAGGDTRFAGTDGAFTPAADYYMNLLNTPQAAQPAQVSPNAMNDYLAKLNASFQYTPQATTPAPAAPPPSTGGYTYDPVTKTYTPPVAPAPVVNPYAPGVSTGEMGGGLSEVPDFGGGGGGGGVEYAAKGGLMGLHHQTNTYAAGGRLLRGPGDGMSDSIPAVIKGARPQRAALADGEFVVPADVVSHLGNGSTEAGSKRLYAMMDKVRRARTGNPKQGKQINAAQFMPA